MTARSAETAGGIVLAAALLGALAVPACSAARAPLPSEGTPGLVFPAHFAEGEGEDGGTKTHEPSAEPAESAKRSSSPPDPEPLRQPEQYEYTFEYDTGRARFVAVRALKFSSPVVTARKMGRFAVELWVGTELVERVRFDFPLLAAEAPPPKKRRPIDDPPTITGGVLKATVLVPASYRARRAVLIDRGTNQETNLDWPPRLAAETADAGAP
ncbi:MAG TPA: hypothetical protein VF103_04655 [Polyangiaceae bacterium]